MVVARGADDAVGRVHEGIGALDDVPAAVMLLRGEIAERLCLLGVQVADGNAAQQRHNSMAVAVKIDGGRSICIRCLVGNVDLGINAQRQDLIRRVGVIAVVMNVCITLGHIGVFLHLLGVQCLYRQRRRGRLCRRGLHSSGRCSGLRSCTAVCGRLRTAAGGHGQAQCCGQRQA